MRDDKDERLTPEAAYELYVEMHAAYTGKTPEQVRAEVRYEIFPQYLWGMHYGWMCGNYSFGRFTELIGVPHWELWEILDALGLPLHN